MDLPRLRMLGMGQYSELVSTSVEKGNDARGALLVVLAAGRNKDLLLACEAGGLVKKLTSGINDAVYIYLWTQMHDDLMWLYNQNDAWKTGLIQGFPWKVILTETFHCSAWDTDRSLMLGSWEPKRMHKYPYALKYIKNPSEHQVLEAACGQEPGYMKAEQIDAFRPGASQWFIVRRQLEIKETYAQSRQAFRQWFCNGVEPMNALDVTVFEQ